jgi:nucleoside-diphosphate-sugar epimerase
VTDGRPELGGKRLLVVGGAGFVGSNLVRRALSEQAAAVTVVDNLLSAERWAVPDDARVRFLEGSIADDAILGELDASYDQVYHLATFHGNQNSIAEPLLDHENNLLTTIKLLERLREITVDGRIVYSASGCSLAEKTDEDPTAVTEDGPVPLEHDSPYQISKVVGEFYCVYYHSLYDLPTVRARFQNVYGPGETLGAGVWRGTSATVWRNVVPTFVYRALKGMPLRLDNGGQASRDFIFVDDIVEGLLRCGSHGAPGDVYNLASGAETTIRELAETILRFAGSDSELEIAPRRSWDHAGRRFGSAAKSREQLGFEVSVGLEDGLRRTVEWTRANMDRIDACVERHADRLATA